MYSVCAFFPTGLYLEMSCMKDRLCAVNNRNILRKCLILIGKEEIILEEIFDIVNESGQPTGYTVTRSLAHQKGIRHRTSHVWLVRTKDDRLQILLQKRSESKDSHPGCYDISSAGHIPAGKDFEESALRELYEELGVQAQPKDLVVCGQRSFEFKKTFHDEIFHDNQVSRVFLAFCDADEDAYILQESEVSEVRWFDFDECVELVTSNSIPHCIFPEELTMVRETAQKLLLKERRMNLIDRAARGDVEAAADLGIAYLEGTLDVPANTEKGLKWCRYAAKQGSKRAADAIRTAGE